MLRERKLSKSVEYWERAINVIPRGTIRNEAYLVSLKKDEEYAESHSDAEVAAAR